jgi:hypothetical protein
VATYEEAAAALGRLGEQITDAVKNAVHAAGYEHRNKIRLLMVNSPRTGRIYRRRRVVHRASAPGEPPAPDTGMLLGSIQITRQEDRPPFIEVGSTVVYARSLEFGSQQVAPRPAWTPAAEETRAELPRMIVEFVRRAMGR